MYTPAYHSDREYYSANSQLEKNPQKIICFKSMYKMNKQQTLNRMANTKRFYLP